jgi:hypothetical protein
VVLDEIEQHTTCKAEPLDRILAPSVEFGIPRSTKTPFDATFGGIRCRIAAEFGDAFSMNI